MKKTLQEIAQLIDADLIGEPQCEITAVLPLDNATDTSISFLNDLKYLPTLKETNVSALIIRASDIDSIQPLFPKSLLLVQDPYLAFAKVAQLFDSTPKPSPIISSKAYISETAIIGKNVSVAAFVSIGDNVVVGDNSIIESNTVIAQNSKIGANCRIYQNVSIYHSVEIGDNCIIHANVVLGSDGFGYANDQGSWVKIPQVGTVIIGDDVEIGSHTAIDRGAMENTIIGNGVILDNHIHIAHNVIIGDKTAIAACTAIAGSAKIGEYCTIAGRVSIIGHLIICDKVHITACTFVNKSITKLGVYSSGTTVQTNRDWQKSAVRFKQLDTVWRKIKSLTSELDEIKINLNNRNDKE